MARLSTNLDLFWLKDKSLGDLDDLPAPDVLAQEIADDLEAAVEQFTANASTLKKVTVMTNGGQNQPNDFTDSEYE